MCNQVILRAGLDLLRRAKEDVARLYILRSGRLGAIAGEAGQEEGLDWQFYMADRSKNRRNERCNGRCFVLFAAVAGQRSQTNVPETREAAGCVAGLGSIGQSTAAKTDDAGIDEKEERQERQPSVLLVKCFERDVAETSW